MIDDQNDGIEESIHVMKEYCLLREDLDSLVELTSWPGKKSPMDSVDGRVKAALTRTYNKEVAPFTYSATTTTAKKKKVAVSDEDYLNEFGEDGDQLSDNDEDDDNVDNDALIKAKKSTAKASTSNKSKASTSRASASTSKKTTSSKKK